MEELNNQSDWREDSAKLRFELESVARRLQEIGDETMAIPVEVNLTPPQTADPSPIERALEAQAPDAYRRYFELDQKRRAIAAELAAMDKDYRAKRKALKDGLTLVEGELARLPVPR